MDIARPSVHPSQAHRQSSYMKRKKEKLQLAEKLAGLLKQANEVAASKGLIPLMANSDEEAAQKLIEVLASMAPVGEPNRNAGH